MEDIYIYVVAIAIGIAVPTISFLLGVMWEQRIWLNSKYGKMLKGKKI